MSSGWADRAGWRCFGLAALVALVVTASPLRAAESNRYVDSIQPILVAKCIACHGPEKQEGGLRLDSLAAAREGGDRGPAIVPGKLEDSLLVRAVRFADADLQMPPKQKLSESDISAFTEWVRSGAEWPEPAVVLFEDEPQFLAALNNGNGQARLVTEGAFSGKAALAVTPLQRDGIKIPGWNFAIRERPAAGEYRYLRLTWKKRGTGSVMLELAASGQWPDPKVPKGRYVAGPNSTGWAAISASEAAPVEWTTMTFDLWQDIGDFMLTGCAPTCDGGEEALFDAMILGPSVASLDAYRPGAATNPLSSDASLGDAFTDRRNPIRKLFRGERLDLWSLQRPVRQDPPADAPHPIDAFVRDRLGEDEGTPAPRADRRTLIRRLTFDLTGLPPTPAEVADFLADAAPDAYAKLVDRLLDSPRYGERQARLWLDVVRYADTHGYERDEFRPLIWQYRDYVIRAFNADKPFDRMILEQLAGDELVAGPPQTQDEADALIATGYLRLGQWDSTAAIFQEEERLRAEMLADLTNTTASAFLGLTTSCCQCHDHKYDPLSQADHYRLRAFFAGMVPRDDLVIDLPPERERIKKQNAQLRTQVQSLQAEQAKLKKDAEADKARHEELTQQIAALQEQKQTSRTAMGAADLGASAPAIHVFYQGDFHSPRDEVSPGFPSVLYAGAADVAAPRKDTTGRRLALARWIASPENPWTARVFVNRIWQQHFGTGLVATPNDFGYAGARPAQPELLDWLATSFVDRGWSVKQLHRLIVTSETYQQSSSISQAAAARDPENRRLARQNVRRLDAESLRDSLLAVSGLLRSDASGPPRWPEVPEELKYAQPAILEALKNDDGGRRQGWYTDPVEETDVLSVFLIRKRCLPIPFLQAFDLPETTVSCARRDTTVVAAQALTLLNSPTAIRYTDAFARRVADTASPLDFASADSTARVINGVFQLALSRAADADERALARDLLKRHAQQHRAAGADDAELRALRDLCRAVCNLNEFLYID
jgi:mono/diheme cytochrome c family protein